MINDNYDDDELEQFVEANREELIRVIKHSANSYARACAWTLLDAGSEEPELEQLQAELTQIREEGAA